jgi:hypothetical protein
MCLSFRRTLESRRFARLDAGLRRHDSLNMRNH